MNFDKGIPAQIISFPDTSYSVPELHEVACEGTGKSASIVFRPKDLSAVLKIPVKPELVVIDFGWLSSLSPNEIARDSEGVPILIIKSLPPGEDFFEFYAPRWKHVKNIIGIVGVEHQYTEKFGDILRAFFSFRDSLPAGTPITANQFQPVLLDALEQPVRGVKEVHRLALQKAIAREPVPAS